MTLILACSALTRDCAFKPVLTGSAVIFLGVPLVGRSRLPSFELILGCIKTG